MRTWNWLAMVALVSSCGGVMSPTDGGTGGGGATGGGGGTTGGGTGGGTTGGGTGGGTQGWHSIALPSGQDSANVTAVHCSAAARCIITTTSSSGDPGALFATTDVAVGEKLVDGAYPGPLPTAANVIGDIDFIGIETTRNGVMARLSVGGAYVAATGDFTQKASWTVTPMGRTDGATFPLNSQAQLQVDAAGKWIYITRNGFLYTSTNTPAATATWTKTWSPGAIPSVPADFAAQFSADPTLCDADVTAGGLPRASRPAYVSRDLNLVVTPAAGVNQSGTVPPGVCVSTDQGAHFYSVAFPGVSMNPSAPGPRGVHCLDNNRCFAFNGISQSESVYLYSTTNASMGKAATWTRQTLPAGLEAASNVDLDSMFFAPDGQHGWLVGNKGHHALLLRTTDGGATWSDVSGAVIAVQDHDLYNGFALDNDHVWLGGRFGLFLATATAQQ